MLRASPPLLLILVGMSTSSSVCMSSPAAENQQLENRGIFTSLVETAWEQNPELAALSATVNAGKARIAQARAQLLPSAALSANYTSSNAKRADTSSGSGKYQQQNGSLQASLRVPVLKPKAWQALQSSRLEALELELALRQSKDELAMSIIGNVLQHIVLREEIHVLETQISHLEAQVHINLRRLEGGLGSRTEVGETRLRLSLAQSQLSNRRSELNQQEIELARLIGRHEFKLRTIAIKPNRVKIAPEDLGVAIDKLLNQNISLKRANNNIALARSNSRLQDRGHWPTLDLIASRRNNHYSEPTQSTVNDTWSNSLTLQFELPLYAGGATSALQDEAAAIWRKAQDDLRTSRESAIAELKQQIEESTLLVQQIAINEAAFNEALNLLEMTRKAFAAGNRDNIDVLNAQQQVSDIGSGLIRSRADYLSVQARTMTLLGELNLNTLTRFDQTITTM